MKIRRIKPVLPSLREKKRYVAFEILSKSKIKAFSDVSKAIMHSLLSFSGELGVAGSGAQVLKYRAQTQRGLVKTNHRHVDHLKGSMALVKNIKGQQVSIRTVGASGILKKAEGYLAG